MEPPSAGWHSSGAVDRSTNGPWGAVAVATEMHSLPLAGHVGRVVEDEAPADHGDGGSPGVVGLRPGGKARQRVADHGPVRPVGGLDDLDVPGHGVGRVGVVRLPDENDGRVGEVERVHEPGARSAVELGAGPRDRREVLGRLIVVGGRDLADRVLDTAQAGLQCADVAALQQGVHGGARERRVGRGQPPEGGGDRRLQGLALGGGDRVGIACQRHVVPQNRQVRVRRGEGRLLVARPGPGRDVGPHRRRRGGRRTARRWRRGASAPAGVDAGQPLEDAALVQLAETDCRAVMARAFLPTESAFSARSTPPRQVRARRSATTAVTRGPARRPVRPAPPAAARHPG